MHWKSSESCLVSVMFRLIYRGFLSKPLLIWCIYHRNVFNFLTLFPKKHTILYEHTIHFLIWKQHSSQFDLQNAWTTIKCHSLAIFKTFHSVILPKAKLLGLKVVFILLCTGYNFIQVMAIKKKKMWFNPLIFLCNFQPTNMFSTALAESWVTCSILPWHVTLFLF